MPISDKLIDQLLESCSSPKEKGKHAPLSPSRLLDWIGVSNGWWMIGYCFKNVGGNVHKHLPPTTLLNGIQLYVYLTPPSSCLRRSFKRMISA